MIGGTVGRKIRLGKLRVERDRTEGTGEESDKIGEAMRREK